MAIDFISPNSHALRVLTAPKSRVFNCSSGNKTWKLVTL